MVADARCVDLPGDRGEMASATEIASNINLARTPGQIKPTSPITKTYNLQSVDVSIYELIQADSSSQRLSSNTVILRKETFSV